MSKIMRDLTENELDTVAGAVKLADAAVRGAIAGAVGVPSVPPPGNPGIRGEATNIGHRDWTVY